ncbi:hypothetical protein [Rhodopseudomonas sp. B29]|uniref:hypothetical protein n=1 Tax=Rhodopseudomonas sp. B29 TaxID=95607 RepID=UPI0003B756A3|nr:hypothetical protein [Rhodopseudomonas sp. B29]
MSADMKTDIITPLQVYLEECDGSIPDFWVACFLMSITRLGDGESVETDVAGERVEPEVTIVDLSSGASASRDEAIRCFIKCADEVVRYVTAAADTARSIIALEKE